MEIKNRIFKEKLSEKQRLLNVLNGKKVDRPPVICPGGIINAAVTEVIKKIKGDHNSDLSSMIETAIKVRKITGFENYGVPFCEAREGVSFHLKLNLDEKLDRSKITKYDEYILDHLEKIKINHSKRSIVVLEAISKLKNNKIPVIGNITGPMSMAISIIESKKYYEMMKKDKDKAMKFLEILTDYIITFSEEMIDNGADIIALSDPYATRESLGKKIFEEFLVSMYKKISKAIHIKKSKLIIHVCGRSQRILESLTYLDADALSFDSVVGIRQAKEIIKVPIMGNISTQLLDQGKKRIVRLSTKLVIEDRCDIISPSCKLSMSTPIENLKVMTEEVKKINITNNDQKNRREVIDVSSGNRYWIYSS